MKSLIVLGIITAVLIITGAAIWSNYTSYYQVGVQSENAINAALQNNENIHSAFVLKVKNALSTSKLNAAQVQSVIEVANKSRYGDGGSKAYIQFITENNIPLDQTINKQIIQLIEAGQNEFKVAQTELIDRVRSYQTSLDAKYFLGSGWWLNVAGFPTAKYTPDKYKPIIDADTQDDYKTGLDKPLDIK